MHYLALMKLPLEHKVILAIFLVILNLLTVILNLGSWFGTVPAIKKQFEDQVNIKLISQLNNGISRGFQKLLRCYNSTIISTPFVSSFPACPVIFCFDLNEILLLLLLSLSLLSWLLLLLLLSLPLYSSIHLNLFL